MKKLCLMLTAALLLVLCACTSEKQADLQPETPDISESAVSWDGLTFDRELPLSYATQFSVSYAGDDYTRITIGSDQEFLLVAENAETPENVPASVTVLHQPLSHIYLVASAAMDYFDHLDAVDRISLSGLKADDWYIESAKSAMEAGSMRYAGKYSAPDYEAILESGCDLAIENTMIYHTPEVKEQLEKFGIPVLVERSSYETDPLARMEWVKLYGILLGKQQEAEQLFDTQVQRVAPLENQQPTGKTVAFFSITSNNLVTVRKGSDYVARMIEMAGGSYVFADLTDSGNNLATINLSLEDFYAGAKDADVLLYNSTIEGSIASTEQLVEKCPLLAQFKAVQNGNVWCTAQSLFQQSMELPDLILDMNRVFTEGTRADSELTFLTHVE